MPEFPANVRVAVKDGDVHVLLPGELHTPFERSGYEVRTYLLGAAGCPRGGDEPMTNHSSGEAGGWPVVTLSRRKALDGKPPGWPHVTTATEGTRVFSETARYLPEESVTGLVEALETVRKLYETAVRDEDPDDPESEWDADDPHGLEAAFRCFARADIAVRAALKDFKESGD